MRSSDIQFAPNHPVGAGHFPGNPIIPGALMLDAVMQVLEGEAGGGAVLIRSAKFFRPVRPGESLRVNWESVAGGVKFECRVAGDDALAASGVVELG
jgi:3-hydroxymyristoyl/3-hydroxydecanoyl-(acyl carrier protein) dehydratase